MGRAVQGVAERSDDLGDCRIMPHCCRMDHRHSVRRPWSSMAGSAPPVNQNGSRHTMVSRHCICRTSRCRGRSRPDAEQKLLDLWADLDRLTSRSRWCRKRRQAAGSGQCFPYRTQTHRPSSPAPPSTAAPSCCLLQPPWALPVATHGLPA